MGAIVDEPAVAEARAHILARRATGIPWTEEEFFAVLARSVERLRARPELWDWDPDALRVVLAHLITGQRIRGENETFEWTADNAIVVTGLN